MDLKVLMKLYSISLFRVSLTYVPIESMTLRSSPTILSQNESELNSLASCQLRTIEHQNCILNTDMNEEEYHIRCHDVY